MAEILKLFGRDQDKIDNGAEYFIDSGDEDYLLLRHGSSKTVRDFVDSLSSKERRLFQAQRASETKGRAVIAKIFAHAVIASWGKTVTWDGNPSPSRSELEKFLSRKELEGLLGKMMEFIADDDNYGMEEFEEDSKNSAKPSNSASKTTKAE